LTALAAASALAQTAPDPQQAPPPTEVKPLAFDSRVEPWQVKLGQRFEYIFEITHSKEQRYELVRPARLGAFELFDVKRSRADAPDSSKTTFLLQMALFELGKQHLPEMVFTVSQPSGPGVFRAQGRDVEALATSGGEQGAELKDVAPPQEVWVRSYRVLYFLLAALAAILAFVAFRWARRRRKPRQAVAEAPLSLQERTLAQLRALSAEKLWEKNKIREHSFRLSEIVRAYLAERYRVDALECTTAELMRRLKDTPFLLAVSSKEAEEFFQSLDWMKFAKQEPPVSEVQRTVEVAVGWVNRTAADTNTNPHVSNALVS
jgi:hypothetical protein